MEFGQTNSEKEMEKIYEPYSSSPSFLCSMSGGRPCFPDNQELHLQAGSEGGNGELNHPPPAGEILHGNSRKGYSMAAMREVIFRIAAMQPINIDPETVKAPKRRNVKISKDPQSVAARHRREKISERIRILQRLVPGGTKMDTASMLDEAIHYVKFLKSQVHSLENGSSSSSPSSSSSETVFLNWTSDSSTGNINV